MEHLTPSSVRALLDRFALSPKKSLGQNFLADPNTARRIATLSGVGPGDPVLEIGPGLGSLTVALVEAGARVRGIELDGRVAAALAEVLGPDTGVEVRVADALHAPLDVLVDPPPPRA